MDFWNDIVTEKSWKILQDLKGFNYILIGGQVEYRMVVPPVPPNFPFYAG